MTEPLIDDATFRELQDTAGEDFAAELVGTFLEEAPVMLDELRAALQAGHADAFRRAAHSLKSNSHTFGALGLGTLARELELQGIGTDAAATGARVATLQAEYLRVAAALKELTGG